MYLILCAVPATSLWAFDIVRRSCDAKKKIVLNRRTRRAVKNVLEKHDMDLNVWADVQPTVSRFGVVSYILDRTSSDEFIFRGNYIPAFKAGLFPVALVGTRAGGVGVSFVSESKRPRS